MDLSGVNISLISGLLMQKHSDVSMLMFTLGTGHFVTSLYHVLLHGYEVFLFPWSILLLVT